MRQIKWEQRYSQTMDDDKHGRWACVGWAGDLTKFPVRGRIPHFKVAWIEKIKIGKKFTGKFIVKFDFPSRSRGVCDTLSEAKKKAQAELDWFLKALAEKPVNNYIVRTDTSEQYDKVGGVYIVSANSKKSAAKIVDDQLPKIVKDHGYDEFVKDVKLLKPKNGEVIFNQVATFN